SRIESVVEGEVRFQTQRNVVKKLNTPGQRSRVDSGVHPGRSLFSREEAVRSRAIDHRLPFHLWSRRGAALDGPRGGVSLIRVTTGSWRLRPLPRLHAALAASALLSFLLSGCGRKSESTTADATPAPATTLAPAPESTGAAATPTTSAPTGDLGTQVFRQRC